VLFPTLCEFRSAMASKTPHTIGAAVCWFAAFLWFVIICTPMNWLWCENLVVRFRINLWAFKIHKGIMSWGATLLIHGVTRNEVVHSIMDLFEADMWMEDGAARLCSPAINYIWKWCDEAMYLKYASFAMIFFGFVAIISLSAGGFFMYYYAHEHATRTGRMWALGCLISAPMCGFLGSLQYLLLTLNFSEAMSNFGVYSTFMYGPGFFVSCMLSLLSCLPLYIYFVFGKKNPFEKNDETYEEDPSLKYGGYGAPGGYGAVGPSGGCASGNAWGNQAPCAPPAVPSPYGAPAPNVYVTQVQLPVAPQMQHYQGPGAGQPAWG